MTDSNARGTYAAFIVGLICLLIYLPALRCGFVNVDDPAYVLNNPLVKELNLATVLSMFTHSHLGWWMPLTWISLALDYHFWGENPFGYHLANILLHAVNAALVVLIIDKLIRAERRGMSVQPGYLYPALLITAGLFFGIHPLRVESVAWVSERKDVLNGFFSFAAIYFYLIFAECKEEVAAKKSAGLYYVLALLCFVFSLMAKSVSVVLPLMLLTFDWLPLGRMRRATVRPLILEKVPFLAASALMAFATLFFAFNSQYLVTYEAFPLSQRAAVSGNAIWEYVRMLLLPVGLSPFNIIPDPIPPAYQVKSVLVLVGVVCIFFSRLPPLCKSCLICFLLPLLPVLAFFQNGDQSFADRFTYLPSLPISLLLAHTLHGASGEMTPGKRLILSAAALVTVLLMTGTVRQIAVWNTSESYWNRVIQVEPLAISYKERGRYFHTAGRYDAAVKDFTAAIDSVTPTLKPYAYNLYAFRAESFRAAGRFAEAVQDFSTAIGLNPHPVYYYHRGLALRAMGMSAEAEEDFRRAGPDPGPINWF